MSENLHRTQKRAVLHLRKFLGYWWKGRSDKFEKPSVLNSCIFSGSYQAAKTTWSTFGTCRAKRLSSAYRAILIQSSVLLATQPKISLHQPLSKTTKPSNCGRVIRKRCNKRRVTVTFFTDGSNKRNSSLR